MDSVILQFLKYPDTIHWGVETTWLGEDRWGIWLAIAAGAKRWKGVEDKSPAHPAAAICVPHDDWWVMHYNGGNTDLSHFIDICTPAVWSDVRVETVDLDLDLIIAQDGSVRIDDEDEFALHQVQLGYPNELVSGARKATERLFEAVRRGDEPFFDVAAGWLTRVG